MTENKGNELELGDLSPYPLHDVVAHFVSRSFSALTNTLEVNSEDTVHNLELMRVLNTIFVNATKVLMLFRWNNIYPQSSDICNYLMATRAQAKFIQDYLTNMLRLYNSEMDRLKTPMYDVMGAIDVIVGRGYSRLPLMIYPPLAIPKYEKDPQGMLNLIKDKLITYLTSQTLPMHSRVTFENGVAKIHVPNQYNLYLSYTDFDKEPKVSKIDILLHGFMKLEEGVKYADKRGVSFIDPSVVQDMINAINKILETTQSHGFDLVNKTMYSFCVAFEMQRLVIEAKRIRSQIQGFNRAQNRLSLVIFKTQTVITITKELSALPIELDGEKIGDAFGKSIDHIIEECKIRIANSFLRSIAHEMPNSTISIDDRIPVLHYEGTEIYIDKWSGNYVVRNYPELSAALNEGNVPYVVQELDKIRKNEVFLNQSFTEPW
ncbi:hypothetical protein TVAG_225650 [Trichomonas vaginalis G3]|uniref:Mediator of RNA polymerase II transcription subunit 14 n=1 Tax=Trichomonas vaginalis (strain ATCC PRA-98 / G3) TaxID=412133 RepID=A2DNU4_TRIV3|nr:Mediator complex, subunit Med14 family [Trichomonas vaginalis G3]EAY17939.1 hypothetical protein TVAG_225650 [Trichomonas vaginalis G3]KAI5527121.1 Mediator complex, subunit Med14 family [Trichomonas vaginalis G3]|eukprot:XP_001578925.1 hypothetical protein [Trichomonas vaginalis G3]